MAVGISRSRKVAVVVWIVFCAAALAWLSVSLADRISPWRLDLFVPSGVDEKHALTESTGMPESYHHPASLSADGRRLAFGTHDGMVQLWDLNERRMEAEYNVTKPVGPSITAPDMVRVVHLLPDSAGVIALSDRKHLWQIIDLDGTVRSRSDDETTAYQMAFSPSDRLAVFDRPDGLLVHDLDANQTHTWGDSHQDRVTFAPSGRFFACSRRTDVMVRDVRDTMRVLWEDDLGLPQWPTTQPAATQPSRSPSALWRSPDYSSYTMIDDMLFSPDGRYLVVVYDAMVLDHRVTRLRLYETLSGDRVWDHAVPNRLDDITFSPDGTRLLTLLWNRGGGRDAELRDVQTFASASQVEVWWPGFAHARTLWMPDGRWVAFYSRGLQLVDTHNEYLPMMLPGSAGVVQVLATADGERLVEIGDGRSVRVWRRRAAASRFGAFQQGLTWAIIFLAALTPLGAIIAAGPPKHLHPAASRLRKASFLFAIVCGVILADKILAGAAGWLWNGADPLSWGLRDLVIVIWVVLLPLAVARNQKASRALGIGVISLIATTIVWRLLTLCAAMMNVTVPFLFLDRSLLGVPYQPTMGWILAAILVMGLVLCGATIILLSRRAKGNAAGDGPT